jgi:hypothetical protein
MLMGLLWDGTTAFSLTSLLGFDGAAALKSLILAAIIWVTARLFVDYAIAYPLLALLGFLALCVIVIAVIFRTGWRLRS